MFVVSVDISDRKKAEDAFVLAAENSNFFRALPGMI
jgi:hypothetical protein